MKTLDEVITTTTSEEENKEELRRLYSGLNECNKIIFEAGQGKLKIKREIIECIIRLDWGDCLDVNEGKMDKMWTECGG